MTENTEQATTPDLGVAERQKAAQDAISRFADSIGEQPAEGEAPPETTQEQSQATEEPEATETPEPEEKAEEATEAKETEEREQPEEPEGDEEWIPSSLDELIGALEKDKDEFLAEFMVPVTVEGETTELPLGEALRGHLREATFTQKAQALADERRDFEAHRHERVQSWQQTTEALDTAVAALANAIPQSVEPQQFVNEDGEFDHLSYEQARIQSETLRNTLIDAYSQADQARAQREEEIKTAREGYKAQQENLLRSQFPAMSDPSKRREFEDSAKSYLQTKGFQAEEADNFFANFDHRLVSVLKDAVDGKAIAANKGKTLKKLKALPRPNPPSSPPEKGDEQRTRAANLMNRLKNAKTQRGRRDAAADLIGHRLGLD